MNMNNLKIDPTRTGKLRKKYLAQITKSFNLLIDDIIQRVVADDVFKLRPDVNVFCATGKGGGIDPSCSPHLTKVRYASDQVANLFGIPKPDIRFHFDESGKVSGEAGSKINWVVNPHHETLSKGLNFKTQVSESEHIAAHEAVHHVYTADSDIGHELQVRLSKVNGPQGKAVSIYGAFAGDMENLIELGAAYSHSPKELKAYSPEMFAIAEEWAKRIKKLSLIINVFCPTGKGGGVDPTCSPTSKLRKGITTSSITFSGATFETGKPVTFEYMRNTQSSPNMGSMFQQDIEVAGKYMIQKQVDKVQEGWEAGTITFKNPLVIPFNTEPFGGFDDNSWKVMLTKAYKGKRGKALARAIAEDGYDGIVTVDLGPKGKPYDTREIIDLTYLHSTRNEEVENAAKHKPSMRKADDFMGWLTGAVSKYILKKYWTDNLAMEAHSQGTLRGYNDRQGYSSGKAVGAREIFVRSMAVKVGTLQRLRERSFEDLEGITSEMANQISETITVGFAKNHSPERMALAIADRVKKIGLTRATILVHNEISRAHSEGVLDALEYFGETTVGVNVEWHTALDPCEICAPLEGMVLTIAQARGLLPRHCRCRCSFQLSSMATHKSSIRAKINKSMLAEIPKTLRSKRKSAKQQRRRSKWMGANR